MRKMKQEAFWITSLGFQLPWVGLDKTGCKYMKNNCTAETIGANEVQPFSYPIQIMKAYPVVSISRLWSKDSTKKNIFFFRENIIWNGCSVKSIKMEHKHKLAALISLLEFCKFLSSYLKLKWEWFPIQHSNTNPLNIIKLWRIDSNLKYNYVALKLIIQGFFWYL